MTIFHDGTKKCHGSPVLDETSKSDPMRPISRVLKCRGWPEIEFEISKKVDKKHFILSTRLFQTWWDQLQKVQRRRLARRWMRQDQSFPAQVELLLFDKPVRLWRNISKNETKCSNFKQNSSTKSPKAAKCTDALYFGYHLQLGLGMGKILTKTFFFIGNQDIFIVIGSAPSCRLKNYRREWMWSRTKPTWSWVNVNVQVRFNSPFCESEFELSFTSSASGINIFAKSFQTRSAFNSNGFAAFPIWDWFSRGLGAIQELGANIVSHKLVN